MPESPSTPPSHSSREGGTSHGTLREQVTRVLDLIRPAVQSDGGDLELVDVSDDGIVTVRFHGACVGCPSSSMTLRSGIEQNLKIRVPGVTDVVAID
jgi:Fe-S cluster biogenesis protein NfuA